MIELSKILTPELIIYPLQAQTKSEVIARLVDILARNGKLSDPEAAQSAVLKREELMTTGVGKGVALPHGKYHDTDEVLVSFGISQTGIDFNAIDGLPVQIFVLLLTPEQFPTKHLKLLGKFSRILNDAGCREELLAADSVQQIAEILYQHDANG
jgi:mannitol/fructose-specific phosphotransferase system IIA component (Ntr-type)